MRAILPKGSRTTALLFLTAGGDLSGYAYSTNGGQTFTDGNQLPNRPGEVNLGDPWLGSASTSTTVAASGTRRSTPRSTSVRP